MKKTGILFLISSSLCAGPLEDVTNTMDQLKSGVEETNKAITMFEGIGKSLNNELLVKVRDVINAQLAPNIIKLNDATKQMKENQAGLNFLAIGDLPETMRAISTSLSSAQSFLQTSIIDPFSTVAASFDKTKDSSGIFKDLNAGNDSAQKAIAGLSQLKDLITPPPPLVVEEIPVF